MRASGGHAAGGRNGAAAPPGSTPPHRRAVLCCRNPSSCSCRKSTKRRLRTPNTRNRTRRPPVRRRWGVVVRMRDTGAWGTGCCVCVCVYVDRPEVGARRESQGAPTLRGEARHFDVREPHLQENGVITPMGAAIEGASRPPRRPLIHSRRAPDRCLAHVACATCHFPVVCSLCAPAQLSVNVSRQLP